MGKTLYKDRERERLQEMEIENISQRRRTYKGNKANPSISGNEKGIKKKNPKINTPISETRFIHSRSIPLYPKHVSYTANV